MFSGIGYFAVYFLIIKQVMPKLLFSCIVHMNGMLHCLLNPLAAAWIDEVFVGEHLPEAMVCSDECGSCRRS